MMNTNVIAVVVALLLFPLFPVATPALADPYPDPSKTITIICNTPPGGMSDMQIRAIGTNLSKHLKDIRVMVENDSGASGRIAYEKAFKAKPDGYTLLNYNLPSPIVTEILEPNVRYKTTEFVPVYAISTLPNTLVVNAETWKTVDEFVQEGQKRTVTIGTTGNKTANFLQAVAFANAAKIKVNFVPFKGGAESTQMLAGKHIDAVVTPVLTAVPLVKGGKLRPLIVFSDDPDNTFPGVLLSKDSKWEIATFPLVGTYVAPPNFAAEHVKILEEAFAKALKEPSFVDWIKKVNIEITPMNAAKVRQITNDAYRNATKYKTFFDQQ